MPSGVRAPKRRRTESIDEEQEEQEEEPIASPPPVPAQAQAQAPAAEDEIPTCLLCEQLCRPETDSCTATKHFGLRFGMLEEKRNYGSFPDHRVYRAVQDAYHQMIVRPQEEAGLESTHLSIEQIKEHFESHAWLVPRRVIGKALKRLLNMIDFLQKYQLYTFDEDLGMQQMDLKVAATILALQTKVNDLIKLYSEISKRDSKHVAGAELTAAAAQNDEATGGGSVEGIMRAVGGEGHGSDDVFC
jgi:hypothetical protein